MKRSATALFVLVLAACTATPDLDSVGPSVSVNTGSGVYSVRDARETHTMKITAMFGQGTEIAVAEAAEKYLREHRPKCVQTDRIELSDGLVTQGIYMIRYRCEDAIG